MQGIIEFQPERLRLARQMYDGLTKAALAEMVDVSPATMSKWEAGSQSPQQDALERLANALQIPQHWFLRKLPDFGNPLFLNRAKKKALKAPSDRSNAMLLNLAEVHIIADEWVNFPKVNLIDSLSRQEALLLGDGKIQALTEQLRKHWGLGKSPIPNLMKLVEKAGVVVSRFDIGYDGMDGTSAWIGGKPYIFIAADKNNYFRERFDLAHELGHIIMHRYMTEEDKKNNFDELERQAHYFASCLLFPIEAFTAEVRRVSIEALMMLKKRWGISIAAMLYKASVLNLISEDQSSRLWRSFRYRGYMKCEPFDQDIEPEKPTVLKSTLNLMLSDGGFAKSNIIDKFALKKHLELLAGSPKGFLNEDFGQLITIKPSGIPPASDAAKPLNESSGTVIKFAKK